MTLACVILGADGELHENQCGGYACNQRSAQGTAVLVETEAVEEMLSRHFTGPKWCGWCCDGIDEETAGFVEALVPGFTVDRARLADSCEAWILGAYEGKPAVLLWENSD